MQASYVVFNQQSCLFQSSKNQAQSFKEKGSFTNMPQAVGINIVCPSSSPLHPNDNIQ